MNDRRAAALGAVASLLALAVYAVLAGIATSPVSEPTPRIPSLLFAAIVPGVVAAALGAGVVLLRRKFALRAPLVGLVVGAVLAALATPTEGEAWLLVLGGPAWLTLLAVGELLGRWWAARQDGVTLPEAERAGVVGAGAGLAYWLVFLVAAVVPAWSTPGRAGVPGPVEGFLTLTFLAGAFCLLVGLPVALAVRGGPYSPLVVPALWVGYDLLTGWGLYADEAAVFAFTLGWPAAMLLLGALAAVESAARWGWRRVR